MYSCHILFFTFKWSHRLASKIYCFHFSFQCVIKQCVFVCVRHAHTFSDGVFVCVRHCTRPHCLTHKLQQCLHTRTHTQIMFDIIHCPQHLDKRHDMYKEIEPLQYNDVI